MNEMALVIVSVAATYLLIGLIVATGFVARGVRSVDPATVGSPWQFKLMIFPGAAALWPWILTKWIGTPRGGVE